MKILPHILMFHVLEVLHLSVGAFGVDHSLERPSQFLHGHLHALFRVERRAGETERLRYASRLGKQGEAYSTHQTVP